MASRQMYMLTIISLLLFLAAYALLPINSLPKHAVIDKLIVEKSERKMTAFSGNIAIKQYRIALSKQPKGHKEFEGDMKTPEGVYTIFDKNPNSSYYKNLGVSYPNEEDRAYAASIQKKPGGDIKIHGLRNGRGYIGRFHRWVDWTYGCIAVTNAEMEELYHAVKIGATIEIYP